MLDSPEDATARDTVSKSNAKGVVEGNASLLAKLTGYRALELYLAVIGVAGTMNALVSKIDELGDGNGGVNVTYIPRQAHAMESAAAGPKIGQEKAETGGSLFDTVFHDLDSDQKLQARETVDMFKSRILQKSNYRQAHWEIPHEYKSVIEETAAAYGISEDALLGIISVENEGGTDITNESSGARGVAQFLPDTARQYGLIVNSEMDQRTDPVLSIDAAGRYLRDHKALFGRDEGLAVWSYHAGAGVVFNALQVYFIDIGVGDIGNYGEAIGNNDADAATSTVRAAQFHITHEKLSVQQLFSNNRVQTDVLNYLDDYSDSYPYQVIAASEILREQEGRQVDLGGGLKISVSNNPPTE